MRERYNEGGRIYEREKFKRRGIARKTKHEIIIEIEKEEGITEWRKRIIKKITLIFLNIKNLLNYED